MRVAVTGASRGVGLALADEFEARGHTVLRASRSGDGGIARVDVTSQGDLARWAATIDSLDALVANAGVFLDRGRGVAGTDPELWAQSFAVNVTGVALSVQALLPALRRGRAPRIAVIASQMGASTTASGTSLAYRASKAAAVNLALNLARGLRDEGIAVAAYHPGHVRTDMGGDRAPLTPGEAARGLADRIESLDLASSGAFETWDGRAHPL